MIGIYKIISPNGRIYIGQSRNIERRFYEYKNLHNCRFQKKLFRSFIKYGIINHNFSVEKECLEENLNKEERFYQEYYNSIEKGLNCFYTKTDEKPRIISEKYKKQISKTLKRKYKSGEIINSRKNKGKKFNIYDFKGDILYENINVEEIIRLLNLSNRSVINNTLRKNRFLSKKQYIIIPTKYDYLNFIFYCIKLNKGKDIPLYQINENKEIKKCSTSSKEKVVNKVLNSENLVYYSKKNNSYYTFIGLINAVLNSNI